MAHNKCMCKGTVHPKDYIALRGVLKTLPFSRQRSVLTPRPDCMEGGWVIDCASCQVYKVSVSWRAETADNRYGVALPENPANIALSGQNDMFITG
jgi:hypothetical protein